MHGVSFIVFALIVAFVAAGRAKLPLNELKVERDTRLGRLYPKNCKEIVDSFYKTLLASDDDRVRQLTEEILEQDNEFVEDEAASYLWEHAIKGHRHAWSKSLYN